MKRPINRLPLFLSLCLWFALFSIAPAQEPSKEGAVQLDQLLEKARFQKDVAGNFEAALEIYQTLVSSEKLPAGEREEVLFQLGTLLAELGRQDESRRIFETALEEFPDGKHTGQIRERLRGPQGGAEIASLVELVGLWHSPIEILELMPRGRFSRLPAPDLEGSLADSEPLAQGTYEIAGNKIALTAVNGSKSSYEWSLRDGLLELKQPDGRAVSHRRTRRPFHFPKDVAQTDELLALIGLKAAEAKPLVEYLNTGGNPEAARDLIAFSKSVDVKMHRLVEGTTSELTIETGLEILALTERLLEAKDTAGALKALVAFADLQWWGNNTDIATYGVRDTGLVGDWRGSFEDSTDSRLMFMDEGKGGGRCTLPWDADAKNPRYTTSGHQITFTHDNSGEPRSFYYVVSGLDLALYSERDGELMGSFTRDRQSQYSKSLELYFLNQIHVLKAALELARHPEIRRRLTDFCYEAATHVEATTAGLLARTALRQMMQVDAAYLAGDQGKGAALAKAFSGTLDLLLVSSLPRQLAALPIPPEPEAVAPVEPSGPFLPLYSGMFQLQPVGEDSQDTAEYKAQAEKLEKAIINGNLLEKALESTAPENREGFLSEFDGMPPNEMIRLMTNALSVTVQPNPRRVEVAAFPHPKNRVAVALGRELSAAIEALPIVEGSWRWRTTHHSGIPNRLVLDSRLYELPPRTEGARGDYARRSHSRSVYEGYLADKVNELRAHAPIGQFVMVSDGEQELAVRIDSVAQMTVVFPGSAGKKPTIETIAFFWGEGPGATRYAHFNEREEIFFDLISYDYPGTNKVFEYTGRFGKNFSVAFTDWTDPAQVRFDDPSLRWYYLSLLP